MFSYLCHTQLSSMRRWLPPWHRSVSISSAENIKRVCIFTFPSSPSSIANSLQNPSEDNTEVRSWYIRDGYKRGDSSNFTRTSKMENKTKKDGILQPQKLCDPIVISKRLLCRNLGTYPLVLMKSQLTRIVVPLIWILNAHHHFSFGHVKRTKAVSNGLSWSRSFDWRLSC